MAKHTILIALLAALVLLVAHTSATREQKHDQDRRCSEQIENLNLKHCEKHIMKKVQNQEDEDEDVLMMRGINYIRNKEDREEDEESSQREKCCSQLSRVNMMDCRCEAMKQVMDSLNDRLEKREMKEAEKEMLKLPMRCGIAPPLGCDLMRRDEE